jgi:hypothetical protein
MNIKAIGFFIRHFHILVYSLSVLQFPVCFTSVHFYQPSYPVVFETTKLVAQK